MQTVIDTTSNNGLNHDNRSSTITMNKSPSGALAIEIQTERLVLTSASVADVLETHKHVMGDSVVRAKYASGNIVKYNDALARLQTLEGRFENGDPFSGFTIRSKEGEFIGHIVAGGGENAGESEIAYLLRADQWRKGYGTEATAAIVEHYVPLITAFGYKISGKDPERIVATARKDNPGSFGILEKLDFKYRKDTDAHDTDAENRSESLRREYARPIQSADPAYSLEILAAPSGFVVRDSKGKFNG